MVSVPVVAEVCSVKFPSKSVMAPLVVPVSTTLAPAKGSLDSESITVPVTVDCEKAAKPPSKKTRNKNFLMKLIFGLKISAKIQSYIISYQQKSLRNH